MHHNISAWSRRALVAGRRMAGHAARYPAAIADRYGTRRPAIALATAAVLVLGLAAGLTAFADRPPDDPAVTVADAARRQDAASRAARDARVPTTAKPPATAEPAPAPAPAPAPNKAPTKAPSKAPSKARPKAPAPTWVSPMPGARLSSCFGPRWGRMHKGLDFAGANATKIRSVGPGRVLAAGWLYRGYGISVVVDHRNGYLSHYAHAQKVLVRPGQWVRPGQALALEGSTGDSTGPHLHLEIHSGLWRQVNPATWLRKRGVRIGC